jgi:hypothetical protein
MKKQDFNQRLKAYSALSSGVLLASVAGAQIVYTDVNPDVTINSTNSHYDVDMNNNSTPDFRLLHVPISSVVNTTMYGIPITVNVNGDAIAVGAGTNALVGFTSTINSSTVYVPAALALNTPINATASWQTNTASYGTQTLAVKVDITIPALGYSGTETGGDWLGQTDKYLGVKFSVGANTHYGWIRLDVASDATSAVIKDFAYDATADAPILAGDMITTSVPELGEIVFWKQQNNISLNFGDIEFQNAEISIYNALGQVVKSENTSDKHTNISTNDLNSGLYIVSVVIGNQKTSFKFIK